MATSANGFAAGDGFTTDQTLPDLDRGNSTYDIRHRLTVSYLWELPFFLHRKGFVSTALAGWQLNGIWAFQSGAHWTPFDPRRFVDFKELAAGACEAGTFDPGNALLREVTTISMGYPMTARMPSKTM